MTFLYNRYITGAWPDGSSHPAPQTSTPQMEEPTFADIPADTPASQNRSKSSGGLKGLFGGNIKLPEFDADTLLLLVLVYFLVADETENISDTLLIIGVLLLLGF